MATQNSSNTKKHFYSKSWSNEARLNSSSSNRINSVGDLLEFYVKDAFCDGSSSLEKTNEKNFSRYKNFFRKNK